MAAGRILSPAASDFAGGGPDAAAVHGARARRMLPAASANPPSNCLLLLCGDPNRPRGAHPRDPRGSNRLRSVPGHALDCWDGVDRTRGGRNRARFTVKARARRRRRRLISDGQTTLRCCPHAPAWQLFGLPPLIGRPTRPTKFTNTLTRPSATTPAPQVTRSQRARTRSRGAPIRPAPISRAAARRLAPSLWSPTASPWGTPRPPTASRHRRRPASTWPRPCRRRAGARRGRPRSAHSQVRGYAKSMRPAASGDARRRRRRVKARRHRSWRPAPSGQSDPDSTLTHARAQAGGRTRSTCSSCRAWSCTGRSGRRSAR